MAIDKRIPEVREMSVMTQADLKAHEHKMAIIRASKPAHREPWNGKKETPVSLPCLNSNNSTEGFNIPSTQNKKTATALEINVKAFVEKFGLNNVGFLTLTFSDRVIDPKEAQRRFNSLRKNLLKPRYSYYIRVFERHENGSIHYHLLVACPVDIRTGLNHQALASRNYKSACKWLRDEWKFLRENLNKYGFGRAELLPIKSNAEGLSKYISKYIGKHIENRKPEDKGYRLVQFSSGAWKVATTKFSYLSAGSTLWRAKLSCWCMNVQDYLNQTVCSFDPIEINANNYTEMLRKYLGSNWAFKNRDNIINQF